jgi:CBS-domain-containing membrane protein
MSCEAIMTVDPPVLHPSDTVGMAVDRLLSERVLALPVIEEDRRYIGMFAKSRLFGLLLPAVVATESAHPSMGKIPELGFLREYLPEMQARLRSIADHPVSRYVDSTVPVLHPDSPVVAAVLQVFRTRNFVPVVDKASGKLAGMISTWDTLAKVREGR